MTVTYFGGPTLEVSFAPTKGAGDTVAGGDWVDITAHVRDGVQIQRGRSSERDTFQTGTCSFTLNNRARLFDPEYAAGTYYGQLLPMRPIRVRMTYSAVTYDLFRGFIQGWPQSWEPSNHDSVVQIVAHDAFKVLATAQLPESRYAFEVLADTPAVWWRLGDENEATVGTDSSGNQRNGYYAGASAVGEAGYVYGSPLGSRTFAAATGDALTATSYTIATNTYSIEAWVTVPTTLVSGTENAPIFTQGSGSIAAAPYIWLYLDGQSGGRVAMDAKAISGGASRTVTSAASSLASYLGQRVHVVYTRSGDTHSFYINGVQSTTNDVSTGGTWSSSTADFSGPIAVGENGVFTANGSAPATLVLAEVAVYTTALSAARALAHYTAGSTANAGDVVSARITTALTDAALTWIGTSLETSTVPVRGADYNGGGLSLLSYLQTLEATEQGRLFMSAGGTLTFHTRSHDLANATIAAAFTDVAGGTLPYADAEHEYDDTRIVNDSTVSRVNGIAQRATNTTSATAYGLRSETIDGLQGRYDSENLSIAQYRVARFKDPAARIRSLTIKPRTAPTTLYPVVATEIGSKVTFRRAPLGGTAFTKTLTVEGVTHSISYTGEWVTTFLTAPVDPLAVGLWDAGTWDTSVWGI